MCIERIRYIVRRKHDSAIMCGLARDFKFKKEGEIGDTAIKTYSSEKKAYSAAIRAFGCERHEIYVEQVHEIYTDCDEP